MLECLSVSRCSLLVVHLTVMMDSRGTESGPGENVGLRQVYGSYTLSPYYCLRRVRVIASVSVRTRTSNRPCISRVRVGRIGVTERTRGVDHTVSQFIKPVSVHKTSLPGEFSFFLCLFACLSFSIYKNISFFISLSHFSLSSLSLSLSLCLCLFYLSIYLYHHSSVINLPQVNISSETRVLVVFTRACLSSPSSTFCPRSRMKGESNQRDRENTAATEYRRHEKAVRI